MTQVVYRTGAESDRILAEHFSVMCPRSLCFPRCQLTVSVVAVIIAIVIARGSGEEERSRKNGEWDQQNSCRPGQAVSDITWPEDSKHFRNYFISCHNFTDSCNETCEWTVARSIAYYGQGVYVRGLQALYDSVHDTQRILFLCCNSSKSMARHCDGKMTALTGNVKGKVGNGSRSFRQARTISGKDGHSVSLLVETCSNSWPNVTVCTQLLMNSRSRLDLSLAGLAGLAGLTGLSGLALVVKTPSSEKGRECCCDGLPSAFSRCQVDCTPCDPDSAFCDTGACFVIKAPE